MGLKASPVSNSQIVVASRFCAETTGRAEMAGLISRGQVCPLLLI